MAYGKIIFQHPVTKEIKEAPIGFSWTMLFFEVFVPLFRGDWKWAIISFLLAIITGGLSWFVFPFIYNKLYIKELIKKRFKAVDISGTNFKIAEAKMGIILPKNE
ncbi:hypothetical protein [Thermosulfurimonas dismutans]|uniref:hypothetical protein n=1 Tax=Thermosulfurimonas dismutans TaxID=999894 RepID=UPI0008399867|nr:hypothetical protein [Thermosulfurimonas dismutans]